MPDALPLLRANLPLLASLCMMQIFPFVVYAGVSPRVPFLGKACAVSAYAAFAAPLLWSGDDPWVTAISHAVAFGYVTLLSLGIWLFASRIERSSKLPSALLFVLLCVAFVWLPGSLLPEPANFTAVAWGFELVFSSYSYLHDGWSLGKRPSLEEGLFFLLINPVLSYPERGRQFGPAAFRSIGVRRCLLGVVALGLHVALIAVLLSSSQLQPPALNSLTDAQTVSVFLAHYAGRFGAGYARHSGGASLSIGAMHLLGFELPERYNHPWRATSPANFWRRWNMYLGSWARRYLFAPWAGRLQRMLRARMGGTSLAKAASVLGTFALIGCMHDLAVFAQNQRWPLGGLLVFGLNGVALLVWIACAKPARALARWRVAAPLRLPSSGAVLSRLFFVPFLLASVWIAIPTMSTDFALSLDDVLSWMHVERPESW